MIIKSTLVGFSGEYGSMLILVLIKNRNAPIPTTKIRQIQFLNRFYELNLCGKLDAT